MLTACGGGEGLCVRPVYGHYSPHNFINIKVSRSIAEGFVHTYTCSCTVMFLTMIMYMGGYTTPL